MKRNIRKVTRSLPAFRSEAAEARHWERADTAALWDGLEEVEVRVERPRMATLALRVGEREAKQLREEARRMHVGHTALARAVLSEWLRRRESHRPTHAH